MVSIGLAHLGAAKVVATDLPQLCKLIEKNAYALNGIAPSRLVAKELQWGDAAQIASVAEQGPFDYIFLSDVIAKIYEPSYEALLGTLSALATSETTIVLSAELRDANDPIAFFSQLKKNAILRFSRIPEDKVEEMYRAPELALFEIRQI